MADDLALILIDGDHDTESLAELHGSMEDHQLSSAFSVLSLNDELFDRIERVTAESDTYRKEAFEESMRHRKAEKEVVDAIRRRQREEREKTLERREELENLRQKVDELTDELRICRGQKLSLECQVVNSDQMIQDIIQNVCPAADRAEKYLKEIEKLKLERDNALKVAEELMKNHEETSSNALMPQLSSEFSFPEIKEATKNCDPSLKIGEGGYGSIYRGFLRHTPVAIKILRSDSMQGPSEFQQEVSILSKLRHPNIVTLIGACSDGYVLVYEYLSNGSLEDRLSHKDNTPPLSWQTRIRIAAELCSVLIFLHSSNPHSIVHGDLKPANILLDANFVCKLSDFGISRAIIRNVSLGNDMTQFCLTNPKGTFAYIDPEFLQTGELTATSDVYSFGIILLRLLTGKPALGITKQVQNALDSGNLKDLIDPTAGNWPFVQAKQLARLAIRCCDQNRRSRPGLGSEVWRVLEPMGVSCGASSSQTGSNEHHYQIPPYFVCPIFQNVHLLGLKLAGNHARSIYRS